MKWKWFTSWRDRALDRDLEDEMQFHLEMRAAEYESRGASEKEALSAAHRHFGSTVVAYEDSRRMHIGNFAFALETFGRDLRFALRSLRRTPSFTAPAVLALALGVGAAAAVFSIADRILFRGLPYGAGDRLVTFGVRAPIADKAFLLGGDYSEWKEESTAFDGFTSTRDASECDISETNPIRIGCARVEWSFLPVFGIQPAAGRNFSPEEDQPKAARVALISHALWQQRYGANPAIQGRQMNLDGQPVTIVGVLPASFEFPTLAKVDVLVPQQLNEPVERERKAVSMVTAYGRLKPGISIAQANTALHPYFESFLKTINPAFKKEVHLEVASLHQLLKEPSRTTAWLLLAAVLCVLLISWTNVANLWLARSASREHETGIRIALGAGRMRLMIHRAAEFAVIGCAGWIGGLAMAAGLLAVVRRTAPPGIVGLSRASLDSRILLFSAAVLLLSLAAFAMLPSRAARGRRMRLRSGLVTAQLAISVVLVTSAGLLMHSLLELGKIRIGIETDRVTTASVVLGDHHFRTPPDRYSFVEQLEKRLRRLPGVEGVALADEIPPLAPGTPFMYSSIAVDGRPLPGGEPGGMVNERHITPEYFRTLGIPMFRGRPFAPADQNSAEGVVILSDRLARRLFPNGDPLGHTVKPKGWPKTYKVVGVAANVKNAGLIPEDAAEMYLPFDAAQGTSRFVSIVVRSTAAPDLITQSIREEIRAIDPTLPARIDPLDARIGRLNERSRFNAVLLSFFAAVGVVLAALGVYGVLAFLVSQRVREIGVRMALGATRGTIARWIFSYALRWTVAGLALGVAGAIAAARQFRSMLYGVSPADPWTLAALVLLLACVGAAAAYVPARRAAALDPAVTLRQE